MNKNLLSLICFYFILHNIFVVPLDKVSAEKLRLQVEDAIKLINEYNNRLGTEVELRQKVTEMVNDFLNVQKELLLQAERSLEVI